MQHVASLSLPINAGPLTITPSFNYTERWYFKTYGQAYNEDLEIFEEDTISGFDRNYNYSFGTSVATKLYGMYSFKKGPLKAIRHTVTPSLSYSASPTFDPNIYGFYGESGNLTKFSPYANSIYSFTGSSRSESIRFTLSNNLEAKVLSRRDTTSKFKKVPIIENLTLTGNYNFAADSLKLSLINISGSTKITKYASINFSGRFDPYAYIVNDKGRAQRVDVFLRETSGKLASFEGGNLSLNAAGIGSELYSRKKMPDKIVPEDDDDPENAPIKPIVLQKKGLFEDFTVPWHLNFGYTLNANRVRYGIQQGEGYMMGDSLAIIQGITFNGDFKLFDKVQFNFTSGYDFVNMKLTPTTIFMVVDLNCWEFSARVIPFGDRRSFNLSLNIKSSMLKDLKLEKKGNFGQDDNFFQ